MFILHNVQFFIFSADQKVSQSSHGSNIAELSPGAVGAGRAEHQAAINSMMLERMSTDISALKKQYSRIKQKQQQQAGLLFIHSGNRYIEVKREYLHLKGFWRQLQIFLVRYIKCHLF